MIKLAIVALVSFAAGLVVGYLGYLKACRSAQDIIDKQDQKWDDLHHPEK
jgi:hypothetical protein